MAVFRHRHFSTRAVVSVNGNYISILYCSPNQVNGSVRQSYHYRRHAGNQCVASAVVARQRDGSAVG